MHRAVRYFVAGVFMLCGFSAAAQADQGVSWDGFYGGATLGGGWVPDQDGNFDNANYFNTLGAAVLGRSYGLDGNGFTGGVQGGYNRQNGPWVTGVDVSLSATNIDADNRSPYFPALDTFGSDIDWLMSATLRGGYAQDNWLGYVKAGIAGADVETSMSSSTNVYARSSALVPGWTLGLGGSYRINERFSVGAEYGYTALYLSDETVSCASCGVGVGLGTPIVDSRIQLHTLAAHVLYHF